MKGRRWSFLTNHTHVLECLLRREGCSLEQVARDVGISRRAVQTIVNDLVAAGYLVKRKEGRRNRYASRLDAPLRHQINATVSLGAVLTPLLDVSAGVAIEH